jgi:predicted nuclease of restriction endonuclease-like (RecB) superfamily
VQQRIGEIGWSMEFIFSKRILLNDDYYRFLLEGRTVKNDITILDAEHIIPFKMKAWIDLKNKQAQGIHINARDLRKHRLDVFRLFPLIRNEHRILVNQTIMDDIVNFVSYMQKIDIQLKDIGINRSKESILEVYSSMYSVRK